MAVAFFVLSIIGAVCTLCAVFAPRRPVLVGVASWILGVTASELPFACLLWSVLLVIVFGVLGTFGSSLGIAAIVLVGASAIGQLVLARRAAAAGPVIDRSLRDTLGTHYDNDIDPAFSSGLRDRVALVPVLLRPFFSRRRDVVRIADLAYGDAGIRNLLDVYHARSRPQHCPVLVYVHGGAWTTGKKNRQGLPIVYHFASRGWVCIAPNYRLCPGATFPDALVDVKRVLAWVREHASEYGGDPTQVFMSGGSAGGHLTALAALTENDPVFQPGFEDVDTSLTAAIPLYGDYDWLDSNNERERRHLDRMRFFAEKILKVSLDEGRDRWEQGSPLYQITPDAPPFFVVHGDMDSLLLVEDTRHFVHALRGVSRQPVAYAELPGAQHAFDFFQSVRCGHVINGMERFTSWIRSTRGRDAAEPTPSTRASSPTSASTCSPPKARRRSRPQGSH